ncbi:MAG: extracellular solute-binding protein [Treponema sp.]|nr:extracellular solute-binding protein [Treponema sp.]
MKRTGKLLSLVALMLLSAGMVFAGGGSQPQGSTAAPGQKSAAAPAQKKILRLMVWGSTEPKVNYFNYFKEAYPAFAAKCDVQWLLGGAGDGNVAEKIRLGLAANESVCDAAQLNYTQIPEFASAGVLQSLESIVAPVRNDMLQGFKAMTEYNGQTVAVANGIKAKIWFYRKDIFDKAGINVENVKTLDDFIAAGKKLQQINPKYMMWALGPSISQYNYMMVLSGTNSTFADKNGKFQLTTDPNFKKLLEAFKKLHDSGVVAKINEWTPDWEKAFADEVLVSYPNATWLANQTFLPKYASDQQKGKWYATQWPSFIGEVGGSEAGGDVYVIPKFSKEVDLAKEYLKLSFLDREGWFLRTKVGGAPVPVMKSWANDPRVTAPHIFLGGNYGQEVIKALDNFKLFGWDPAAALELSIFNSYFDAAVNGTATIDDSLKSAQAALESQVGNPWKR